MGWLTAVERREDKRGLPQSRCEVLISGNESCNIEQWNVPVVPMQTAKQYLHCDCRCRQHSSAAGLKGPGLHVKVCFYLHPVAQRIRAQSFADEPSSSVSDYFGRVVRAKDAGGWKGERPDVVRYGRDRGSTRECATKIEREIEIKRERERGVVTNSQV